MEIKDLILFKAVAGEGSISRTAQKLNYVQSTVTMRIKQLEHELRAPLFIRNGKGVEMTENGKALLPYAEQMIQLMEQTVNTLRSRSIQPSGTLKIGATESTAAVRLPQLLAGYCNNFPEVDLILETHTSTELIRLVAERKLEGAFVAGIVHHPELNAQLFRNEELILISKHSLSSFRDIGASNLIVFSHGCSYRSNLEKWLHEEAIFPQRILEFGSIEAIIGCVKAGMGIAVMMKAIVDDPELVQIPLPEKYASVPTQFITRKDSYISPALQEFLLVTQKDTYNT
ncbi:LysR family transcriptional regulator [Sporolactobacillus shoreae]|uniref:LysR family transcriptional regulator n=1 Tax=Sporolactobacillus shoreae TaxID=1465501 RepID=A0A4Z0GRZ9_9BACL|nr:LysR family transcriptional regulator [Sporolactobacillus shoreae]TGA98985.1 LysR family transcriptional regulator [Sporolactobacillus shoreae]